MSKSGKSGKVALVDFVLESSDMQLDEAETRLVGVAAKTDIINRNNRYYSREVFEKAVERVRDAVNEGAFTGELDHPETNALGSLEKTAFMIDHLAVEGDKVVFGAKLLDTDAGRNLRALLVGGVKVGMSTRGVASVKWKKMEGKGEVAIVQDDYELLGIDAVKVPSNEAGIVRLRESLELITEQQHLQPLEEREEPVEDNKDTGQPDAALTARVAELEVALSEANAKLETVTGERDAARAELETTKATLEGVRKAILGEDAADDEQIDETAVAVAFRAMEEKVDALKAQLESERAEKVKAERQAAVRAHFDKRLEKHAYADILRAEVKPEEFETVEALDARLEGLTKMIERINESKRPATGKGIVETEEDRKPSVVVENPWIDEEALRLNSDLIAEDEGA